MAELKKDLAPTNGAGRSLMDGMPWTREEIELIKDLCCKGATDSEFKIFLYAAKHSGLDPLKKQIHAVKRWDSKVQREAMVVQTGIDGYRAMAKRTGEYRAGKAPTWTLDKHGKFESATAFIERWDSRTESWHEVSATAFYEEYVQVTKDGSPNSMWKKMPRSQLAKCAEALAIRKAFPDEVGQVRTDEEMAQADGIIDIRPDPIPPPQRLPLSQSPAVVAEVASVDWSKPVLIDNVAKLKGKDGAVRFSLLVQGVELLTLIEDVARAAKAWKEGKVPVIITPEAKDGQLFIMEIAPAEATTTA